MKYASFGKDNIQTKDAVISAFIRIFLTLIILVSLSIFADILILSITKTVTVLYTLFCIFSVGQIFYEIYCDKFIAPQNLQNSTYINFCIQAIELIMRIIIIVLV